MRDGPGGIARFAVEQQFSLSPTIDASDSQGFPVREWEFPVG
ncbi:MAG: hypothetical protein R3C01_12505 [Planctomycetaceae bacterium]